MAHKQLKWLICAAISFLSFRGKRGHKGANGDIIRVARPRLQRSRTEWEGRPAPHPKTRKPENKLPLPLN